MHLYMCHDEVDLLKFKPTFEQVMFVGVRQACVISSSADPLWFSHTTISRVYI